MLGGMVGLVSLTVDMYLPALPAITREFGASPPISQLTLAGAMLGLMVGHLVAGPTSDAFGRRRPAMAAILLYGIACGCAALAPSMQVLVASRVIMGMSAAAAGVIAAAIVRDLFAGRRLIVILSRLALVAGFAPIFSPLIGAGLVSVTSWRVVFVMLALLAILLATATMVVVRETIAGPQGAGLRAVIHRYASVIKDRVVLGVLLVSGATFAGLYSYLVTAPFLFEEAYGATPMQFAVLFAINALGMVVAIQVASRWARRIGPQWVLASSTALLVASSAAILIVDGLGLGGGAVMAPLFLFVGACGLTSPCVQILVLERHGDAAGTAYSLVGIVNFGLAAAVSPVLSWIAAQAGITAAGMAGVMLTAAVVGTVAFWVVVRPRTVGPLSS